jgi:ABC-type sulfate transport system permease subunit
MFYIVGAFILFFVLNIAIFVEYNRGKLDYVDTVAAMAAACFASLIWIISIPIGITLGAAWLIAKFLTKGKDKQP